MKTIRPKAAASRSGTTHTRKRRPEKSGQDRLIFLVTHFRIARARAEEALVWILPVAVLLLKTTNRDWHRNRRRQVILPALRIGDYSVGIAIAHESGRHVSTRA